VAVAITAMLLMITDPTVADTQERGTDLGAAADAAAVVSEATATFVTLLHSFYGLLPRLGLALLIGSLGWMSRRVVGAVLLRTAPQWQRRAAAQAIASLAIYLGTAVAVLTVLAGDVRAMVGSVGLLGLAASWALQTPIESFTGWLLNAFRGYYRVGDRIAVGEVFGDVHRIDMLTTTVWEAGGPDKSVRAAQSTGALITFPNWEVLRSNVVNYSRDFPYVWDEVTFSVTNESDLAYTSEVIERTAHAELGREMGRAVETYEALLRSEHLDFDVDRVPRVYLSLADAWTNCTLRYLVPVRTRRSWASRLVLRVSEELAAPAHAGRITGAYPRSEVRLREAWQATPPSGDSA
jgi:small-conductance mechanosensitive channel